MYFLLLKEKDKTLVISYPPAELEVDLPRSIIVPENNQLLSEPCINSKETPSFSFSSSAILVSESESRSTTSYSRS